MSNLLRFQMEMFRKHPDIIPLAAAVACVSVGATLFVIRNAVTNPDVSWNKRTNPEPWNEIQQNQRTKLLTFGRHNYKEAKFPDARPSMATDTYKNI